MLISAANATSVRKPFAAIRRAGGKLLNVRVRRRRAREQVAPNGGDKAKSAEQNEERAGDDDHPLWTTPSKSFFAPIPLASEASPVRIQAAYVRSAARTVRSAASSVRRSAESFIFSVEAVIL
jgi:hypothetical protein